MLFWLICLVLTLLVVALIVRPLVRPVAAAKANPDIAVYRAQLDEIERDLEREVLSADDAERARTEVARRLLAASQAETGTAGASGPAPWVTIAVSLLILAISFGTYWQLGAPGYGDLPLKTRLATSDEMRESRPSQSELAAAAPPTQPVEAPAEYLEAIEQLRDIAPTRPDDIEAWTLLAFHETELRNYTAAVTAQGQVIEIKGDGATLADQTRLIDLMVAAAGGLVSPEAEAIIRDVLARDETDVAARYYLGVLFNQTDRPDLAFRLWRGIVETGDAAGFHAASARAQIEDAAFRAGITYELPEIRGPSAADIANAQDLSAEDRQAMIGQMVAGLADRLANQGGSAAEWARLITAYGVLEDSENAQMIWTEAQDAFGSDSASMDILTDAARNAGLIE